MYRVRWCHAINPGGKATGRGVRKPGFCVTLLLTGGVTRATTSPLWVQGPGVAKGSHVLSQGWTVPSSSHTATQMVGISEVEVGWEVENGVPEPP